MFALDPVSFWNKKISLKQKNSEKNINLVKWTEKTL